MRGKMIVVGGLILVGSLGGCVAQDVKGTLDAATTAESRLGETGGQALASVAALSSRLGDSCARVSSSLTDTIDRAGGAVSALASSAETTLDRAASGIAALGSTTASATSQLEATTARLESSVETLNLAIGRIGPLLDAATRTVDAARPGIAAVSSAAIDARETTLKTRELVETGWGGKLLPYLVPIVVTIFMLHVVISFVMQRRTHKKFEAFLDGMEIVEPTDG